MATDAPSAAIRRLMAAPIPRVPPMINATLPRNGSDKLLLPVDGRFGRRIPRLQALPTPGFGAGASAGFDFTQRRETQRRGEVGWTRRGRR